MGEAILGIIALSLVFGPFASVLIIAAVVIGGLLFLAEAPWRPPDNAGSTTSAPGSQAKSEVKPASAASASPSRSAGSKPSSSGTRTIGGKTWSISWEPPQKNSAANNQANTSRQSPGNDPRG